MGETVARQRIRVDEETDSRVIENGHPDDSVRFRLPERPGGRPGDAPGIEWDQLLTMPRGERPVTVTVIDYCPARHEVRTITDLNAFLAEHRPAGTVVRWINVDGIDDPHVIRGLAKKYSLHPLAIEDLLHVPQRPKVDPYEPDGDHHARLFVIARMLQLVEGRLESEQISMFLGHNTVLTFQEQPGDCWDPIRQRIARPGSRLRQNDASFLLYALIDSIVDHCFPILEEYGDRLEALDDEILENPSPVVIRKVHTLKRELLVLRRDFWPLREVVNALQREPHDCMSDTTRTYLRDVYDHLVQILDIVENYREIAIGIGESYMTAMSNRMNEVMKVLTIIATIFIPITFFAGVYGMNFEYLPELKWRWAYPTFWIISGFVAGGMLLWFRRRDWI